VQLRYGTIIEERDGVVTRVVDRDGEVSANLVWRGRELEALEIGDVVVRGELFDHPLLGRCHRAGTTALTALDWARPTEIPTLADPGALPPGSGGAILNTIALLAERAGVAALRYAGPYPTPALWRTLARSFRCTATEAEFSAAPPGSRAIRSRSTSCQRPTNVRGSCAATSSCVTVSSAR
jgi:hypothetical protein